jgi:hypothetical protein
MKKLTITIIVVSIFFILFSFKAFAGVDVTATVGNAVTIYNMDSWGKNDHNVTGPNFSQASVDVNNKIIKARAYASYGIPYVSPSKQEAAGYLGTTIFLKPGQIGINALVRITFNGSYNGLIGALGVAAGRVIIEGLVTGAYDVPDTNPRVVILDTSKGLIPSGAISSTFNRSLEVVVPVGGTGFGAKLNVIVACGTAKSKIYTGVCDNDFYNGSRQVKLNWIKVEVVKPGSQVPGVGGGPGAGQGPGSGWRPPMAK